MSNIEMHVEFTWGTPLNLCVEEAKTKAAKWDVSYVCFDYNGAAFSIGAKADVDQVLADFAYAKSHFLEHFKKPIIIVSG